MIQRMWHMWQLVSALFVPRSGRWESLKNQHLRAHPECIVCGNRTKAQLTAHHRVPVSVDPSKELDPSNLRTMCRDDYGFRCHLVFGHLGWYELWNPDIDRMASEFRAAREEARKRRYANDCGT